MMKQLNKTKIALDLIDTQLAMDAIDSIYTEQLSELIECGIMGSNYENICEMLDIDFITDVNTNNQNDLRLFITDSQMSDIFLRISSGLMSGKPISYSMTQQAAVNCLKSIIKQVQENQINILEQRCKAYLNRNITP